MGSARPGNPGNGRGASGAALCGPESGAAGVVGNTSPERGCAALCEPISAHPNTICAVPTTPATATSAYRDRRARHRGRRSPPLAPPAPLAMPPPSGPSGLRAAPEQVILLSPAASRQGGNPAQRSCQHSSGAARPGGGGALSGGP
ncbi:hypothetical protein GCM10009678_39430 [Actinomadura kijaniata]